MAELKEKHSPELKPKRHPLFGTHSDDQIAELLPEVGKASIHDELANSDWHARSAVHDELQRRHGHKAPDSPVPSNASS